jgi:serine/threonine protein kinase
MPAPINTEEFIELTRKSGIFDGNRLDAYIEKLRNAGSLPSEPAKLAEVMRQDGILTQFQAENFLQGRWRRFTIGKYKVLERIATGGMGSVYLCEHKSMRRRAAVKVLPIAKAKDPASLERFYREARAVAALDHPNIVRAYDVDQEEDLHFLVMEYVDGTSLQDLVRKEGPLHPNRAASYVNQAALGLQHAHEVAGLVHRDIKPGNLIVDRNGTVKLLDMGLARFFLDEEDLLTKKYDENVLGTADYLAPEQVIDSHEVDIRADIYSLGATFYYCLTGRTPFGEGTTAQKLIWHQTRQVKPVRSIREDVPPSMEAVLNKMLAKDPAQRFQTPVEVANALAPWVQSDLSADALTQTLEPPPEEVLPSEIGLAAILDHNPEQARIQRAKQQKVSPSPSRETSSRNTTVQPEAPPSSATRRKLSQEPDEPRRIAATLGEPARVGPSSGKRKGYGLKPSDSPISTAEEESLLGSSTTDTQETLGKADTEPSARRKRGGKKAHHGRERSGRKSKSVYWGAAVGVVGAGLVLAASLVGWRSLGKRTGDTLPHTRRYVMHQFVTGAFRRIRDAVANSEPGDHIVIKADWWDEQLDLRNVRDITIEGDPEMNVVWHYPGGSRTGRSLLVVDSVENVRISGLTLDGQFGVAEIIRATGHCPGLTLENVTLTGSNVNVISLASCAGTSERPVSLAGLKITTEYPIESGLSFEINNKIKDPKINENIVVRDCLFQGPFKSACRLDVPTALERLTFLNNKFLSSAGAEARLMLAPK